MGALRNNAHGTMKGGCLWVDTSSNRRLKCIALGIGSRKASQSFFSYSELWGVDFSQEITFERNPVVFPIKWNFFDRTFTQYSGGKVSPRKSLFLPACYVLRQWLRKWQAKCSSTIRIKISNLSRRYCSDFLDLEILRSLLSFSTFWNETSSGVMNFKYPFLSLSTFYGNHTDKSHFWGPVHSKIEEFRHSTAQQWQTC